MSGRIEFTMGIKTRNAAAIDSDNRGFRIYILGNFSGRSAVPWEQRKIRKIDVDNFNQVMSDIAPTLEVGTVARLQFASTEDFHPDVWLKRVPILADLLQLKKDLANPNTAAQAAAKINAFLPGYTPNAVAVQPPESAESDEDTLERLLGRRPEPSAAKPDALDKFIQQLVAPHISQETIHQHRDLIKVIEATVGEFMRTLLHSADFQALEALWRATEALVNEEATDEQTFFLVDVSRAELVAECQKHNTLVQEKILQHLQSAGDEQDVLLLGDYGFSDTAGDKELLGGCGRLARACQAYFLSGAEQSLIEHIRDWTQQTGSIPTDSIVLSYPRYLLRLPYGAKRDPIEALSFEESSVEPRPEQLLWGNSAFLCARSLIKSRQGQSPEQAGFFSDVPAFIFDRDGEQVLQPATEMVLTEAQANTLAAQGITPLIGFRQRQGIRLLPVLTLAERG